MRPAALRTRFTEFARGLGDFRHNAGADNWTTIASLIETCKLNTVDPLAYLTATPIALVRGHIQTGPSNGRCGLRRLPCNVEARRLSSACC